MQAASNVARGFELGSSRAGIVYTAPGHHKTHNRNVNLRGDISIGQTLVAFLTVVDRCQGAH